MYVDSETAGCFGGISAGQERREHTREHVAASGSGHPRVACGVEVDVARRGADGCEVAFQHDEEVAALCQFACGSECGVTSGGVVGQGGHLFGMGRQNGVGGQASEQVAVASEQGDGVGVNDGRRMDTGQLFKQGFFSRMRESDARSDADCCVWRRVDWRAELFETGVVAEDSFWHTHLQYVVIGSRSMYGYFSDTSAQASPCRQDGGAGHAERTSHEQGVAERPFVAEGRPRFQ